MNTRDRIIKAAKQVIDERGLARATTKEIARAAGLSEGTLYNHFEDKPDLFMSVLTAQAPEFFGLMANLPKRAGSKTVRDNLEEVARTAVDFYYGSIPLGASIFSETELLNRHRALLLERGIGPHKANEIVAAYLEREQELGRIGKRSDLRVVADFLLGACFQRAYWVQHLGQPIDARSDDTFVEDILEHLMCLLPKAGTNSLTSA